MLARCQAITGRIPAQPRTRYDPRPGRGRPPPGHGQRLDGQRLGGQRLGGRFLDGPRDLAGLPHRPRLSGLAVRPTVRRPGAAAPPPGSRRSRAGRSWLARRAAPGGKPAQPAGHGGRLPLPGAGRRGDRARLGGPAESRPDRGGGADLRRPGGGQRDRRVARRQALRADIAAETRRVTAARAAGQNELFAAQEDHARRFRDWQGRQRAFSGQPVWYPVTLPGEIDRVDLIGGTLAGWSALLTMLAVPRLAARGRDHRARPVRGRGRPGPGHAGRHRADRPARLGAARRPAPVRPRDRAARRGTRRRAGFERGGRAGPTPAATTRRATTRCSTACWRCWETGHGSPR